MTNKTKSIEKQLEELIKERDFFISTNGTGQEKKIYLREPTSSDIYADTIRKNAKHVKVDRLYELNAEFGPSWADKLWKYAVHQLAEKKEDQLFAKAKKVSPGFYEINGKTYDIPYLHEWAWQDAYNEIAKEYDIPDYPIEYFIM